MLQISYGRKNLIYYLLLIVSGSGIHQMPAQEQTVFNPHFSLPPPVNTDSQQQQVQQFLVFWPEMFPLLFYAWFESNLSLENDDGY